MTTTPTTMTTTIPRKTMITTKTPTKMTTPMMTTAMTMRSKDEWKPSEKVCFHEDHHGSKGYYRGVDFKGCKTACEYENKMEPSRDFLQRKYTCRSVFYDNKTKECYGDIEIKGCYDSKRWQSGDCKLHQLENGYHNFEFAEIIRNHKGCEGSDFECPCTINYDGQDYGSGMGNSGSSKGNGGSSKGNGGSSMGNGHPRCHSDSHVCDAYDHCWGGNHDDELLSNCPKWVKYQAEEGNGECIDPFNGGVDYRGNISVSAKGEECMDWYEAKESIKEEIVDKTPKTLQEYLNHESFQGEHNHCRNMLLTWRSVKLQPSPVCYVKGVGSPAMVPCSIPTCSRPKRFQFSEALKWHYEQSMNAIIEESGSDYNYFIQTEGCEMSMDDWWKNIAGCAKFNPHDEFGLCLHDVCEQDSEWHKCIRSSCKLPKWNARQDIVNLIRKRYETMAMCSSHSSKDQIQKCLKGKTKEDLATPNGKWAECINGMFKSMSTCGIPKYWSFPNIED